MKLADFGITYRQSSDWQKLAQIPKEEFEAQMPTKTRKRTSEAAIIASFFGRSKRQKPVKVHTCPKCGFNFADLKD